MIRSGEPITNRGMNERGQPVCNFEGLVDQEIPLKIVRLPNTIFDHNNNNITIIIDIIVIIIELNNPKSYYEFSIKARIIIVINIHLLSK